MGLIQQIAGNILPARTALLGNSAQIISDASRAVLSAVYPNQYESFELTLQLLHQGATSSENPITSFSFPVMPESLMMAQKYLMNVTPTLGGVFVDDFGRAPSPISLQGTFGKRVRQVSGSGLTSNTVATGYGMVKNLSDFVEKSHKVVDNGKLPTVVLYNWAFNSHWEVVISGFDVQMSVQQNGLWVYSLQLITLKEFKDSLLKGAKDRVTRTVIAGLMNGAAGSAVANVVAIGSAISAASKQQALAGVLSRKN